ncbi:protease inhibitor I42 family protein [Methanosarcina sp. T3]|uniref:protease inhibitor I42 family protein n=1 Tax=Methanosarcina sp. T3 TaxID=3439062 RepID=UPI003F87BBF7
MKKILKLMAMLLVIAAVVFAAGCAENPETAENETPEDSEHVTPATPETSNMTEENVTENITEENTTEANETVETGQVVTEADNGTSISLNNGENFTLQLRGNPTTGYSWQLNVSEGLSILDEDYAQDEAPEESTGVPGTYTWIIQAVAPGTQQVNGIYMQQWENTTGTEDNFTLTVEVE